LFQVGLGTGQAMTASQAVDLALEQCQLSLMS
jgi:hypothetical protein